MGSSPGVPAGEAGAPEGGGAGLEAGLVTGAGREGAQQMAEKRHRTARTRSRGESPRKRRTAGNLAGFPWLRFSMRGRMVIDRTEALERFRRGRRRTKDLFALIPDSSYLDR